MVGWETVIGLIMVGKLIWTEPKRHGQTFLDQGMAHLKLMVMVVDVEETMVETEEMMMVMLTTMVMVTMVMIDLMDLTILAMTTITTDVMAVGQDNRLGGGRILVGQSSHDYHRDEAMKEKYLQKIFYGYRIWLVSLIARSTIRYQCLDVVGMGTDLYFQLECGRWI